MGQWKLQIKLKRQFGINIELGYKNIIVNILFWRIWYSWGKEADGIQINLFKWEK